MELWDAYDADFNKIEGVTLVRGEEASFPDDVFHLVCDILARHTDGTYLLMQRDPRKSYGGMWEASAGGSALQGETPADAARRELLEETGIVATDLVEVGRIADKSKHSIYAEFLCVTDWDKDKITLQEGETVAYRWVSTDELLSLSKDELVTYRIQQFIEEFK